MKLKMLLPYVVTRKAKCVSVLDHNSVRHHMHLYYLWNIYKKNGKSIIIILLFVFNFVIIVFYINFEKKIVLHSFGPLLLLFFVFFLCFFFSFFFYIYSPFYWIILQYNCKNFTHLYWQLTFIYIHTRR
jgi:hypothetical protein